MANEIKIETMKNVTWEWFQVDKTNVSCQWELTNEINYILYTIKSRLGYQMVWVCFNFRNTERRTLLNVKHGIWHNDINLQFNVNRFEWWVITYNRECISFLHATSKNHILLSAINYYLFGGRRVKINMPDMYGLTFLK